MLGSATTTIRAHYRGRFASLPTGNLHFGSLFTAVASYADARAHGGLWLLRIEDLDRTRAVPGAAAHLIHTLQAFGFIWDEPIIFQRDRTVVYQSALAQLTAQGLTYPCSCSRSNIAQQAQFGIDGAIYPGICRHGFRAGAQPRTIRLRTTAPAVRFIDRIQGQRTQHIEKEVGDFVLRRADGIHAYQLAVVVDDAAQGITHIVRGADLLISTPRQLLLQQFLGLAQPNYAHLPLIVDADGRKLSKSLTAAPVDPAYPLPILHHIWQLLNQEPLPITTSVTAFWQQAIRHWQCARISPYSTLHID
ncbi:tRNA glutamyl-Q(34) synthetase GluQRS [Chromatium okenii]|jgi:glutamyl-Q tRNA(Asp) synthetase|uniref:Glutamyl-Q tRNA(Asp) synthetase n=1 Tax=Chromatium okenii TaxID=61644 RepID=A0A2S7XVE1_9GAMM|nr:tRNA glutamyl-Q(34) synthetase GluQRS [Chromatium okenii]PQJ97411.1 tRNA glutamyl-Q(34) synthetase GluQRS [Chromatium okenii]